MGMKARGRAGPGSAGLQAGVPSKPDFGLLGWETGCPGGVHAGSVLVRGPEAPATAGLEASATLSAVSHPVFAGWQEAR